MAWTNFDGLLVRFGEERGTPVTDGTSYAEEHVFEIEIDAADLPALADINDDRPHLPAGSLVTGAYLIAKTAFTGTGTLTIGTGDAEGSAIDADGIDAAVDVDTVLAAAGDVVKCDGEQVDETETIAQDAWVYATTSGTVNGTATLRVTYIRT